MKRVSWETALVSITLALGLLSMNAWAGGTCEAMSETTLKSCVDRLRNPRLKIDSILIKSMIACTGKYSCQINLNGLHNKTIMGTGVSGFIRTAYHQEYSIIDVGLNQSASNIIVKDLIFDENALQHDESTYTIISSPIRVMSGEGFQFQNITVQNYNDRAMWFNKVSNLTIENSRFINGQHLGIVIGQADIKDTGWGVSNLIKIRNNQFYKAGLNSLVLGGVRGSSFADNIVENNVFDNSHYHGLYDNAGGIPGNIHGGGMIYLQDASYVVFKKNSIQNGFCDNCQMSSQGAFIPHEVRGIELDGEITREPNPGHQNPQMIRTFVKNIQFIENTLTNLTGAAFFHNYCQPDPSACPGWNTGPLENIELKDNRFYGNYAGLFTHGELGELEGTHIVGKQNNNTTINMQYKLSFEDTAGDPSPNHFPRWSDGCTQFSVSQYQENAFDGPNNMRLVSGPDCHQVCTRSSAYPITPGQWATSSGWVRSGHSPGKVALIFLNSSYSELGQSSQWADFTPNSTWSFKGTPTLIGIAPEQSQYAALQFCLEGENAVADFDRVTIGISN